MRIGVPQTGRLGDEIEYRVTVDSANGSTLLWYRLDAQFADFLTDASDGPLLALLIPAMAAGEDIEVEGGVSARLHYHLSGRYQRLLRHLIPALRPIAIRAAGFHESDRRPAAVATGFSGGVDSFFTLAEHDAGRVSPGFGISHLLFNNVGSHGRGERGARLFRARHERTAAIAARLGLPLVRVDSNLDAFYGPGLDFMLTHPARNVSVALLLQRGLGRYLSSSATGYPDVHVAPTDSLTYCDTIALPMLGTASLDVLSVGSESTRVEKTLRVAEMPASWDTLDICTDPDRAGNCSACWKCLRTMLTLDIAGLLDRYAGVFDLAAYARRRERFTREVVGSDDLLYREIAAFARERGYRFPLSARLRSRLDALGVTVARTFGRIRGALAPAR